MARIGTSLFGACNEIKGLGYVQTKFFHFGGIPLCALQSYFIIPRPRDRGSPIAISIPRYSVSVKKAYLEALFMGMTAVFFSVGIGCLAENNSNMSFQCFVFFAMAVIFGGALCASYKIQRYASYERAKEIGRQLGSRPIADLIDRIYNEQELDLTEEGCSQEQNNDDSEAGIVMAEAAPIREPSSSSSLATMASTVPVHASENEKIHGEKEGNHHSLV